MLNIPRLYQKVLERFDRQTEVTLHQFQKGLSNLRISKKEWYEIAKELEQFGVILLLNNGDSRKTNQHTKIKFVHKGLTKVFFACFSALLVCIVYLLTYLSIVF